MASSGALRRPRPPAGHGEPVVPREIALVLAGAGGIVAVVVLAIALRSPLDDADRLARAFDKRAEPAAAEAPPSGAATAPPAPSPTAKVEPAAPPSAPPSGNARVLRSDGKPAATGAFPVVGAQELRDKIDKDLQTGNFGLAVADIDALLHHDPSAADDKALRSKIVDLAMRVTVGGGTPANELFTIITDRMGTHGADVLYELVTTRGGSKAATRAEDMLKKSGIVATGTPALQIAWELRTASCDKKADLFDRANKDGDGRAFGQLVLLANDCRRRGGTCCMSEDPKLKATIAEMKKRLNVQ